MGVARCVVVHIRERERERGMVVTFPTICPKAIVKYPLPLPISRALSPGVVCGCCCVESIGEGTVDVRVLKLVLKLVLQFVLMKSVLKLVLTLEC